MLMDVAEVQRFKAGRPSIEEGFRRELQQSLEKMRGELRMLATAAGTEKQKIIRVLHDEHHVCAPSIIQYCLAVKMDLPRSVAHLRPSALTHFAYHFRHYNSAWGSFVPESVKEEGAALIALIAELASSLAANEA